MNDLEKIKKLSEELGVNFIKIDEFDYRNETYNIYYNLENGNITSLIMYDDYHKKLKMTEIFKFTEKLEKLEKLYFSGCIFRESFKESFEFKVKEDLKEISFIDCSYYFDEMLNFVKKFKKLESISITKNYEAIDLTVFEGFENLKKLSLKKLKIKKLNSLKKLKKLESIALGHEGMSGIGSLKTLKNFKALKTLDLSAASKIKDISPLAELDFLETLILSGNKITDISILENFDSLKILKIDKNPVSDISSLKNLTELKELNIERSDIKDISPLKSLKNLEKLYAKDLLWYSPGNTPDILNGLSVLTNLKKLKTLTLGKLENMDTSLLKELRNLEYLSLENCKINNIEFILNLKNLKYLNLHNNEISDISLIKNLVNLKTLTLSDNNISDILPLENLVNLKTLNLSDNNISDISSIQNLINIETIELQYNDISDISSLEKLTKLKYIRLYSNNDKLKKLLEGWDEDWNYENILPFIKKQNNSQILNNSTKSDMENLEEIKKFIKSNFNTELRKFEGDIPPWWASGKAHYKVEDDKVVSLIFYGRPKIHNSMIAKFTNLKELSLDSKDISDILFLESLKKLEYLVLSGNSQIKDFSPLKNLENLKNLELIDCGITDLSFIKELPTLEYINLDGNNISDLSIFGKMKHIKIINIGHNNISDLYPLKNLKTLEELSCEKNNISDLSPLKNLKNLKILNLTGNKISNIIPLENLTGIKDLSLKSNEKVINNLPGCLRNMDRKTLLQHIKTQKVKRSYKNISYANLNSLKSDCKILKNNNNNCEKLYYSEFDNYLLDKLELFYYYVDIYTKISVNKTIELIIEEDDLDIKVVNNKSFIFNHKGNIIKSFPKTVMESTRNEFKNFKKKLKNDYKSVTALLEESMVSYNGRAIHIVQLLRNYLFENSLFKKLSLSILWGEYEKNDEYEENKDSIFKYFFFNLRKPVKVFFMLEDGTFTDLDGNEIKVDKSNLIKPIHPVELTDEELKKAKDFIIDYEIIQPFKQIERSIYKSNEEINYFDEFEGKNIPSATFRKALHKKWNYGAIREHGIFYYYTKEYPLSEDSLYVTLNFSGHHIKAKLNKEETVTLGKVEFGKNFNEIDDLILSEIYNELNDKRW